MATTPSTSTPTQAGLARVLGLRELVIYGLILIQPTAPMPPFGVISQEARGHVVTTILIGMIGMLFTAISYGRMARAYPSAGSAYTYVGRELHPALGYFTGWGMIFDYIMNPIICVIWCSQAALGIFNKAPFFQQLPFAFWAVGFATLFSLLNLRGIKSSARTNQWVAAGLGVVIVVFFAAFFNFLFTQVPWTAELFTRPFYDPETFSFKAVATGTSLAVLTYIGFDGISTLSEEAHNPRRNILLATVLTCLITGILASAQVYAAQIIWPDFRSYPNVDTAFAYVAGRAGGEALFFIVSIALLFATIGSGMGAHLGASRLLYGMGRDNAIPRRFFGVVHPRTRIPRNNVLLVGTIALVGAFTLSYQLGAELLNFGALIAFMGVNVAALVHYYVRSQEKRLINLVPSLLGFLICFFLWWSLRTPAKLIGLAWLVLGVLYGAWRTGGFRRPLVLFGGEPEN